MGRFAQMGIRGMFHEDDATRIEDSLHRWIKTLPEELRMSTNSCQTMYNHPVPKTYNLKSRQLSVLYLTSVILLYRSKTIEGPFPTAAVLAASVIAGVFEDFLARDEVRFLGPCYSFHLLAASIALLSCYKYSDLWIFAQKDLETLTQSQQEMKKKWPTALGSISSFDRMFKLTVASQPRVLGVPETSLSRMQAVLLEDVDMDLCRMHDILRADGLSRHDMAQPIVNRDQIQNIAMPGGSNELVAAPFRGVAGEQNIDNNQVLPAEEILSFDPMFYQDTNQLDGAMGDWLFWNELASNTH
jgi:hypothetical protein